MTSTYKTRFHQKPVDRIAQALRACRLHFAGWPWPVAVRLSRASLAREAHPGAPRALGRGAPVR